MNKLQLLETSPTGGLPASNRRDGEREFQFTEGGFLLLENCDLFLDGDYEDGTRSTYDELPLRTQQQEYEWIPVTLPQTDDTNESAPDSHSSWCSHCHAPIHIQTNDLEDPTTRKSSARDTTFPGKKARFVGRLPQFDGTVGNCIPDKDLCTCDMHGEERRRSDVALLAGLAFSVQAFGHIQISSIQILPAPDSWLGQKERIKGSICICFDVREIQPSMGTKSSQSKSRQQPRKFLAASSKALPYATQTLLSIMRTDWIALDELVASHVTRTKTASIARARTLSLPLFPTKLTLEAVYQRIRGAQESSLELSSALTFSQEGGSILCLPEDVLVNQLCVFLKARTVDSLRCSCKYLHKTLRSVVPGLKLELYTHQVRSLSWMRRREVQSISEADISDMARTDTHMAATGGATVLIRSRSTSGKAVRIAQHSGEEVKIRMDDPLARKLARGGKSNSVSVGSILATH